MSELRSLRKSKGLSLREVARRSGVNHGYLSNLETGMRNRPKPETVRKISIGLGESYENLMAMFGYLAPDQQSEQSKLYNTISKLEDENRQLKERLKAIRQIVNQ